MQKIYVLQCVNNKYYVGKTANIDRRFAEHCSGRYGSEWTARYPPLAIVEVMDMLSEFDEGTKTLEYMRRYGIDHVRGAQWSNVHLTPNQRTAIMAAMNTNGCFRCGEVGHFANECQVNRYTMFCERCGRNTHTQERCYASYGIDDRWLGCARCGRESHSIDECYARSDVHGRRLFQS